MKWESIFTKQDLQSKIYWSIYAADVQISTYRECLYFSPWVLNTIIHMIWQTLYDRVYVNRRHHLAMPYIHTDCENRLVGSHFRGVWLTLETDRSSMRRIFYRRSFYKLSRWRVWNYPYKAVGWTSFGLTDKAVIQGDRTHMLGIE